MKKRLFLSALIISSCGIKNSETMNKSMESAKGNGYSYNAVFVLNGSSNSISVINANTLKVTDTILLQNANFPHHIDISTDNKKMAIAVPGMDLSGGHGDHGGHGAHVKGSLIILNASSGEIIKSKTLDHMNHNGIFSDNGEEIWTSQMISEGKVLVLNSEDMSVKQTVTVGKLPAEVTFSYDGLKAFVANGGSNNVTVIDPITKTVLKTIAVGSNPVGAWAGRDNIMYVDNEAGKSIAAINATNLEIVRTYNLGFTPAMAAVSSQGELWITDTDNGKVVVFSTSSLEKLWEIPTAAGAHGITFSEDGNVAFITNQIAGTVSVISVQDRVLLKNIEVGMKPNGIAFRTLELN